MHHVPILEFHCLGTGGAKLAADDNLNTLSAVLHGEEDNTVGGHADWELVEELVLQTLGLDGCAETTSFNTLDEELERVGWVIEALLDERGELSEAYSAWAHNIANSRRTDGDLSAHSVRQDIDSRVALLSKGGTEEAVQLSLHDSIGHELSLFADF